MNQLLILDEMKAYALGYYLGRSGQAYEGTMPENCVPYFEAGYQQGGAEFKAEELAAVSAMSLIDANPGVAGYSQ